MLLRVIGQFLIFMIQKSEKIHTNPIVSNLDILNAYERWGDQYAQISRSWRGHWTNLNTLFNDPEDIRKVIYTTNAI